MGRPTKLNQQYYNALTEWTWAIASGDPQTRLAGIDGLIDDLHRMRREEVLKQQRKPRTRKTKRQPGIAPREMPDDPEREELLAKPA